MTARTGPPPDGSGDRAALARAIALAERARAASSPNPPVGCVLARDGRIVGDGVTAPAGGPHAEVVALAAAGDLARGATAYVTLEPCAHHGRTPPCTDALLAAGVSRVVYALRDPNPLAAGGAAVLAAAGIEVAGPEALGATLPAAVGRQLEAFLHVVATGRPHVTLKLAQTADGRLVAGAGRRWITGPAARRAVHRWRAAVDAVLVGSGTVLADDPRLDVRDVATSRQPRVVVLDARLRTRPDASVVRPGTIIVTAPDSAPAARRLLEDRGVVVRAVAAAPGGGVDLVAALSLLARLGVTSVLAEPGATLAGALVEAGLVDRLVLHVADDADRPPRRAVPAPPGGRWWAERIGGAGPDLVLHLRPQVAATIHDDQEAA